MKTNHDQPNNNLKKSTNKSDQAKLKYQRPKMDELGSLIDLTAGGLGGTQDGNFTGTNPL